MVDPPMIAADVFQSPLKRKRLESESRSPKMPALRSPAKSKSLQKVGSVGISERQKWNPRDPMQMQVVKEALHVGTSPANIVCREMEQKRIFEFCKTCLGLEKAGSLYVCGCPGTGKTLSITKVQKLLLEWSQEVGIQTPDTLSINCTSLSKTTEIFSKILESFQPPKNVNGSSSCLQLLNNIFSEKSHSSMKMMVVVIDELDYLITKDREVLHDLFMLTTLRFSKIILIGIANAIDLADRFLPKLKALNCKPTVIAFSAYSKDQIVKILQERLSVLGVSVFQHSALEFCARKVAAASGDMRRALDACRNAVDVLEAELQCATMKQNVDMVSFAHMDVALSRAFKSPVVDTIQSLPQHQQIVLCSMVKLLHRKKFSTIGELNKEYLQMCKSTQIPAVGTPDFVNMCNVLADQGLLKLGQSRDDKLRKVTLKIEATDIIYAFKEVRFFRNCLE